MDISIATVQMTILSNFIKTAMTVYHHDHEFLQCHRNVTAVSANVNFSADLFFVLFPTVHKQEMQEYSAAYLYIFIYNAYITDHFILSSSFIPCTFFISLLSGFIDVHICNGGPNCSSL